MKGKNLPYKSDQQAWTIIIWNLRALIAKTPRGHLPGGEDCFHEYVVRHSKLPQLK